MGSIKSVNIDKQVHKIWEWAISKNNWLSATHIPGILNVDADRESRKCETRTEWMLNKSVFKSVIHELLFSPSIDLFSTPINTQLTIFVSYRPDPQSKAVDAFTIDWGNIDFYAFPPFSCITRVIQKIWKDKAKGILVVPDWPNQPWYGHFLNIIVKEVILYPRPDLLVLPNKSFKHPMHQTMRLRAALVLGE